MPSSPEIIALQQSVVDAKSAVDTLQQAFADSLAQGKAQITDLQTQVATKDARIAELEAAASSAISAAEVAAVTASIQALTADIASTPTT